MLNQSYQLRYVIVTPKTQCTNNVYLNVVILSTFMRAQIAIIGGHMTQIKSVKLSGPNYQVIVPMIFSILLDLIRGGWRR